MRVANDILAIISGGSTKVPPTIPYHWENGDHDIEKTIQNAPIIAMAMVHEGASPTAVTISELDTAREAADAEEAGDAVIEAFHDLECDLLIFTNWSQYSNWYLVLVACHQVRELSASNIQNFCKMSTAQPLPPKVISYLSYWAAQQESLIEVTALRARFDSNKFFEYHTSGSSTPKLCEEALDEVNGLEVFTDSEIEEIVTASEKIYDLKYARDLDTITLVKVRAVHEASGTLPEVWYMGSRAVSRFSGKKYSALVKYLKAIFNLQTQVNDIGDMDFPALATNMRKLIDSFGGYEEKEVVLEDTPESESGSARELLVGTATRSDASSAGLSDTQGYSDAIAGGNLIGSTDANVEIADV